jgi:hypothetical protein
MRRIIEDTKRNESERLMKIFEAIRQNGTANIGIINYSKGSFSTPMGVDVAIDKKLIMKVLKKAKYIKKGSFVEDGGTPVLRVTGDINLAEEVPVPDIEPDIGYPYLQKDLYEKLGIARNDLYMLIWKFDMKGIKKYHMEVTTSKTGKVHKFSDVALQYLAEILNEHKSDNFLEDLRKEYKNRNK